MIGTRESTIEHYTPYRVPYRQGCDWSGGCQEYATHGFMSIDLGQAKIYRCLKHVPKWQSTYAKAFQYGIPEVHARYPGVHFDSFTFRHPSGATVEVRDHNAVFTYGDFTYTTQNPGPPLSDLFKQFELEDWDWHIIVPGVVDEPPKKRFETGDPELYTHCQACGEPVEPMQACWSYGQYHKGKCYDTLFTNCLSCGKHRMDAQTNRSPRAHLRTKYAAELCGECLNARWKDKNFKAFVDEL